MRKMRDLFKKIGDIKGPFHARKGTIKVRNAKDLTEAEEIKNRWQVYTEELYKKDLNDPDNHNVVITHLEPDILGCEVKWFISIMIKPSHFCPLLGPSLHEMVPWYPQFS